MTNKYFISDEQCNEIIGGLSEYGLHGVRSELRNIIKQVVEPILNNCLAECEAKDRVIAKLRSDLCKLEFGRFAPTEKEGAQ